MYRSMQKGIGSFGMVGRSGLTVLVLGAAACVAGPVLPDEEDEGEPRRASSREGRTTNDGSGSSSNDEAPAGGNGQGSTSGSGSNGGSGAGGGNGSGNPPGDVEPGGGTSGTGGATTSGTSGGGSSGTGGSPGPGPTAGDAACAASQDAETCDACCAQHHAKGAEIGYRAYGECMCGPSGACASQCQSSFCAGQEPRDGDACVTCLEGADARCGAQADQACAADADCVAYQRCFTTHCQSKVPPGPGGRTFGR